MPCNIVEGWCITPCNIFSFFKRGGGYTFTFILKTDKPDKERTLLKRGVVGRNKVWDGVLRLVILWEGVLRLVILLEGVYYAL